MNRPSALRVWAGISDKARCKWCREPIVFRTTDRGKLMPMKPTATAIAVHQDERGRTWETLNWSDVHRCAARPKPAPKPREEERFVPPPLQRGLF